MREFCEKGITLTLEKKPRFGVSGKYF